jgi:hypothetical protein
MTFHTSTTGVDGFVDMMSRFCGGGTVYVWGRQLGKKDSLTNYTPTLASGVDASTTWTDLSRSSKNGTLTGGCTYSSINFGSIVFDGTNDFVSAGNLGTFYTAGTISYWFYSTAVEDFRNVFSTHYLGGNIGIRFEQYTTIAPYGGFNVYIGNDAGTYNSYKYLITTLPLANTWYQVVLTWNTVTPNVTGYWNSVSAFSNSHSNWATTLPSISIGSGFDVNRYFKGNISIVQIYNRALTQSEVTQNFNATKGRFGL